MVHCTINGFSGYICLPSADVEKVKIAFNTKIISREEALDNNVTTEDLTGNSNNVPRKRLRGRSGSTDTSGEDSPTRKRRTSGGDKAPDSTRTEATRVKIHSSTKLLPKDKPVVPVAPVIPVEEPVAPVIHVEEQVVVKRTRRTKLEMEAARSAAASNSTAST